MWTEIMRGTTHSGIVHQSALELYVWESASATTFSHPWMCWMLRLKACNTRLQRIKRWLWLRIRMSSAQAPRSQASAAREQGIEKLEAASTGAVVRNALTDSNANWLTCLPKWPFGDEEVRGGYHREILTEWPEITDHTKEASELIENNLGLLLGTELGWSGLGWDL